MRLEGVKPYYRRHLGFNSRTLGRVRQRYPRGDGANGHVSIHAPWEGCDAALSSARSSGRSFNSRTLGRVRPSSPMTPLSPSRSFNSRTLGRVRLPRQEAMTTNDGKFQFTHPGKGATGSVPSYYPFHSSFNSRTLGRVRPESEQKLSPRSLFQFTHPGKGAT